MTYTRSGGQPMPRAVRIVCSEEVVVVGPVTKIKAQQYRTAIDIPMWAGLWLVAGMAPTLPVAHQPTSEHPHGIFRGATR